MGSHGHRWKQIEAALSKGGVVVLDGSVSTELQRRRVAFSDTEACAQAALTSLDALRAVHEASLRGGAHLVVCSTYYTTHTVMAPAGRSVKDAAECTRASVAAAVAARDAIAPTALVLGSLSCHPPAMPPGSETAAGVWPPPSVELRNACAHARHLRDGGCDAIVVEMIWDLAHASRAVEAACSVGLPVVLSFSVPYASGSKHCARILKQVAAGDPLLVGGTGDVPLSEAVRTLTRKHPSVCAVTVHQTPLPLVLPALRSIRDGGWSGILGAYPMQGAFSSPNWGFCDLDRHVWTSAALSWVGLHGAQMIGVGAGVTPAHLRDLVRLLPALTAELRLARPEGLHRAAARCVGDVDAAAAALPERPPDVDGRSRLGQTALHAAAAVGNVAAAGRLLAAGADTTVEDQFGQTAGVLAVGAGQAEVVAYLASHAQGPRMVFTLSPGAATETLGLDLRERSRKVRVVGLREGVGRRSGVVTGVVVELGGLPVRKLEDFEQRLAAMRSELPCGPYQLVVQTDPAFTAGTSIEVLKDLVHAGKLAVRKGTVTTVQGVRVDDFGGRRIVIDVVRLDGKSGALGAMPFEVAPVAANATPTSSANPVGQYYDPVASEIVAVTARAAGGFAAASPSATWSPAVVTVTGTVVALRGRDGTARTGVWCGNSIRWADAESDASWVRAPTPPPAAEAAASASAPAAASVASQAAAAAAAPPAQATLPRSIQKKLSVIKLQTSSLTNTLNGLAGVLTPRDGKEPRPPATLGTERVRKGSTFVPRCSAHEAAAAGRAGVLETLVQGGERVDQTFEDGRTLLHVAAEGGHRDVVEYLLKQGCDTTVVDKRGHRAADLAALGGQHELRHRLREAHQGPRRTYNIVTGPTESLGMDLKSSDNVPVVVITNVRAKGAAERARIEPGGTIVCLNGKRVVTVDDVVSEVTTQKAAHSKSPSTISLVVQLAAPPLCPSGHTMRLIHGAPEDVRAYMAGDDLTIDCDICGEEDLQDRPSYYHCIGCWHDVCTACRSISEYAEGKRVQVVTQLVSKGRVAAVAGARGKVTGMLAREANKPSRIVVSVDRCDEHTEELGVLPSELMPLSNEDAAPDQWVVVSPTGCPIMSEPSLNAEQMGIRMKGEVLTVLEAQEVHGERWMLTTCGDTSRNGWVVGRSDTLCRFDLQDAAHSSGSSDSAEWQPVDASPPRHTIPCTSPPGSACRSCDESFLGLRATTPEQEGYLQRWVRHCSLYSTSDGLFTPPTLPASTKIWATSDIHVDHKANMEWLRTLPPADSSGALYKDGTIIVAGDVCTKLDQMQQAFKLLSQSFKHVFYCVGNHELWLGKDCPDSVEKFFQILELCRTEGVHTVPCWVGPVFLCPLQSWYQANFLSDGADPPDKMIEIFDGACKWPASVGDAANPRNSLCDNIGDFFLALNEHVLKHLVMTPLSGPGTVMSFSHFIPRPELFPGYRKLNRVMGTRTLDVIISKLRSSGMPCCRSCVCHILHLQFMFLGILTLMLTPPQTAVATSSAISDIPGTGTDRSSLWYVSCRVHSLAQHRHTPHRQSGHTSILSPLDAARSLAYLVARVTSVSFSIQNISPLWFTDVQYSSSAYPFLCSVSLLSPCSDPALYPATLWSAGCSDRPAGSSKLDSTPTLR